MREYVGTCHIPKPASCLSGSELDRLYRHIEVNIDSPLTVADLASLVGRSQFHFSRLFKASTGTSPHKYVISRRVERARELLLAGRSIVDVALATGFSSQSHLSHHIRRAFGCTPGELISRQ
ncbi:helix-turn-helix domain-containing protein [Thalassoroseus pseudoceratinae]|uniref:helix-turn-helix domain-containing protein n=1 Tax=Thalassoroseus pseudoceratinae TaxID=2713176 RepID=UPI0036F44761